MLKLVSGNAGYQTFTNPFVSGYVNLQPIRNIYLEGLGDDSDPKSAEICCQNSVAMTTRGAYLEHVELRGNGEFLSTPTCTSNAEPVVPISLFS